MTSGSYLEDYPRLVQQILAACGASRMLDVGCGSGILVREFLKKGFDAYGVNVSSAAAGRCNRFAQGRFFSASILALPFSNDSFDTLISIDGLEYLDVRDVLRALQEMHRVCRRSLFLRVTTGNGKGEVRCLTSQPRVWWENTAFEAGFRKHPSYYRINPFESLEDVGDTITMILEKIPDQVLSKYSLRRLSTERDLHMDMLREAGRRSDAHVIRYQIAASLVRPSDVVVDSACGMGYGSHLLASLTSATSILGIDVSESAVEYSADCYSTVDERVYFRVGDVQDLSFIRDHSIDLFVSFETLEHIPDPGSFIDEMARVTKPGGRVIVSVPNLWVDESGKDPSPWHLHVYDWQTLCGQFAGRFLLERAFLETAGGGMRLPNSPRKLSSFDPINGPSEDGEWLILVAMLDPRKGKKFSYQEQMYGVDEHPPNLISFARDYLNPYLVHSMVSMPWRIAHPGVLRKLAEDVMSTYPSSSPDYAAAVCVLAYQMLEKSNLEVGDAVSLIARVDTVARVIDANPHYLRWQISTAYVAGLLALKIGDFDCAIVWFRRCSELDCREFSPTLATKTISAAWQAGRLLNSRGETQAASHVLRRGIDIFFEAMSVDRNEILGCSDVPFDFPYFETTEIAAAVTNCVNLLRRIGNQTVNDCAALPVENLQSVVKLLQEENNALRSARDEMLLQINKHWSVRLSHKLVRFVRKGVR